MVWTYNQLFSGGQLRDVLSDRSASAMLDIESIQHEVLLNENLDQICERLVQEHSIEEFKLEVGKISISRPYDSRVQDGLQIDPYGNGFAPGYVKGTAWEVHVPFKGESRLLFKQASTMNFSYPYAAVDNNEIIFEIQKKPSDAQFNLDSEIDKKIAYLEKYLTWSNNDIKTFNKKLRSELQGVIQKRKEKVIGDWEATALSKYNVVGLTPSPRTYAVELVKKRPEIEQSASLGTSSVLNPALSMAEYERILTVLSNMAEVFERDPGSFENSDEETLRTHFLAQLNGIYGGTASGETFNKEGKTDIFLREKGKAIFIAECKFWRGEKQFSGTIDQLLGYLTWRETKVAIILLNRNKGFSDVLSKINKGLKEHGNYVGGFEQKAENIFRAKFSSRDDREREIILTVLAFDVPARTEKE